MPTIRVDVEVYKWLECRVRGFDDTPNKILRRIAKLDAKEGEHAKLAEAIRPRGEKTPRQEFRKPLLQVLLRLGGAASRNNVLTELEKVMSDRLTLSDREDIASGDCPSWQKSAEWMVHSMRTAKLLKPVSEGPYGYWILTDQGKAAAKE